MSNAIAVSVEEGYERWAPTYPQVPGNPLMRAEEALMRAHLPPLAGRVVLDMGCGSGRYTTLLGNAGAHVVALDLSAAMLARVPCGARVRASMARLPFAPASFDVALAGLAIGHLAQLSGWCSELARVLRPTGRFIYSDFHPAAAAAGFARTFKDEQARTYSLPHYVHSLPVQQVAAAAAGLELTGIHEARAGIEMTESFEGSEQFYRRWHGLPLVLVVSGRRL
jgi:malonyl-CoA O-methyltransferase